MALERINYAIQRCRPVSVKCAYYSEGSDCNKVVIKQRNLYKFSDIVRVLNIQNVPVELNKIQLYINTTDKDNLQLVNFWLDNGIAANKSGHLNNDIDTKQETLERIAKAMLSRPTTPQQYIEFITNVEKEGGWIGNLEIAMISLSGDIEYANRLKDYRQRYKERKEEERVKKDEERRRKIEEREKKEKVMNEQEITNAAIALFNRQPLKVTYINDKSILIHLFDRYKIKLPIKTRGYIDKRIFGIAFIDVNQPTECISLSYEKGHKPTENVFKYINLLVYTIINSH